MTPAAQRLPDAHDAHAPIALRRLQRAVRRCIACVPGVDRSLSGAGCAWAGRRRFEWSPR